MCKYCSFVWNQSRDSHAFGSLRRAVTNTTHDIAMVHLSASSQEDITLSSPSEERKGLLSGVDTLPVSEADEPKLSQAWFDRTLLSYGPTRVAVVIGAIFSLVFSVSYWLSAPPCSVKALHFNGDTLRSNGTHEFKRTVLLVSIDGLRDAIFDIHSSPRG
jgi:hypothetical protein